MKRIILAAVVLVMSGCFRPHCRNPKDGRFISCKDARAVIVVPKVSR